MRTMLIVADVFYGEAKTFCRKDYTVLQEGFLIKDKSTFDECYKLFSPFTDVVVIQDSEDSNLAERVKRLAIRGGFNGTILATLCQSVSDIPTVLLPEKLENFSIVLEPYSNWPALKKETEVQPKEPFPSHCLPEAAREFCQAVATATGTPVDFAALSALGCIAGAVGGSTRLVVKPGWMEYAVLWLATVAPPGSAKTPVQGLVMRPLREIQSELSARFQQAVKNYDAETDEEKPTLEVLLYGDTTTEGLLKSLASSQRGGVLVSDELTSWIQSHNKYQKGGNDRQCFLSLWSSTPVSVLRKQDGICFIPLPVLSVLGGLTPSSLPSLHGGSEDGFLSRFLIAYPDKRKQTYSDIGVSEGAQYAWQLFIKHLWSIEPETNGGGVWLPATVNLTTEAHELFKKFYNDVHTVLDSEVVPSLFRGSWSKAPSQLARLALVVHLGRQACGEEVISNLVSADTMDKAIQVMNYFIGHLSALETGFDVGASRAETVRLKILSWLKRYKLKNPGIPAKQSILRHDCKTVLSDGGIINEKLFQQILESLQVQHFIRRTPVDSIAGRKSDDLIAINPNL